MTKVAVHETVEALFSDDGICADADITVMIEIWPADPPSVPGDAEMLGWSVNHFTLFDDWGNPIEMKSQATPPEWMVCQIDDWVSRREEWLIDRAVREL